MASSASLVVRISADINDFAKKLDQMTRGVDKAADRVTKLGEKLAVGVTVPLAAAATAMVKFAADAEDTSARFDRVFGAASESVKASLEQVSKVVPETIDDLEKMATSTDLMLQGMEVAPDKAAAMSQSLVSLAGDMAAVAHIPISEALDKLQSGLAGRSRGLIEVGLAFSKTELEQEAYRQGLLHVGSTLRESGTAQAAFNLIMKNAGLIQGEAGRTAGEASKSWEFLVRDLKELAVSAGQLLLPAFVKLVDGARAVVDWFNNLDKGTKQFIIDVAKIVGTVGPVVFILGKLTKAFFDLSAAVKLMSGAKGLAGVFTAAATPIGETALAIAAMAAVVYGLAKAWDTASDAFVNYLGKRNLLPKTPIVSVGVLPGTSTYGLPSQAQYNAGVDARVLGVDEALAKHVAGYAAPPAGKGGKTDERKGSPFEQFVQDAGLVQEAFQRAVDYGTPLAGILAKVNSLHEDALGFITGESDQMDQVAVKAQKIADELQRIQDIAAIDQAPTTEAAQAIIDKAAARPRHIGALGAISTYDASEQYREDLAKRSAASQYKIPYDAQQEAGIKARNDAQSYANDLNLRAEMLGRAVNGLPPGFDAARQAAVEYAEGQQAAKEQTALAFETIKIKLGVFGTHLDGLSEGMQNVVVSLYNSAQELAQSILSTIGGSGRGASTGRGIGGLLGGIAGAFFGPVGTAVGSAVGSAIGGEIGGALDHSALTHPALDQVAALRAQGFTADEIAKKLNAPINEIRLDFQQLDKAVNSNTSAVTQLTQAITNVPAFFRIGKYEYEASPAQPATPLTPNYPGGVPPTLPKIHNPAISGDLSGGDVHFNGPVTFQFGDATSMKDFYEQIKQLALRDRSTGSASAMAFQRA